MTFCNSVGECYEVDGVSCGVRVFLMRDLIMCRVGFWLGIFWG